MLATSKLASSVETAIYFATEPIRAAVCDGKVVIHCFRHMNGLYGIASVSASCDTFRQVSAESPASVIKEIADVMCFKYLDQALVFAPVLFETFQFVAARTKCARWRMTQGSDGLDRVLAGIDQIFRQGADDSVTARIYFSYVSFCWRAVSISPAADALMTAVTPPD